MLRNSSLEKTCLPETPGLSTSQESSCITRVSWNPLLKASLSSFSDKKLLIQTGWTDGFLLNATMSWEWTGGEAWGKQPLPGTMWLSPRTESHSPLKMMKFFLSEQKCYFEFLTEIQSTRNILIHSNCCSPYQHLVSDWQGQESPPKLLRTEWNQSSNWM